MVQLSQFFHACIKTYRKRYNRIKKVLGFLFIYAKSNVSGALISICKLKNSFLSSADLSLNRSFFQDKKQRRNWSKIYDLRWFQILVIIVMNHFLSYVTLYHRTFLLRIFLRFTVSSKLIHKDLDIFCNKKPLRTKSFLKQTRWSVIRYTATDIWTRKTRVYKLCCGCQ